MSLRRRLPPQWLTLESNKAAASTIAITITCTAGAPTVAWRVLDGGQIYEYSGDALSHVVQVGPCKIEARIASKHITGIDFNNQYITKFKHLKKCVSLLGIYGWSNLDLRIDLSDLPQTLDYLNMGNCPLVGGDIADLSSQLTYLDIWGSLQSTGADISHMIYIVAIHLQDQFMSQSRVNGVIQDIYDHKDEFTYATPSLNVDGNNAAPDAEHIALIEELVADYSWTISYTLPS